jgi:hypothetical protein
MSSSWVGDGGLAWAPGYNGAGGSAVGADWRIGIGIGAEGGGWMGAEGPPCEGCVAWEGCKGGAGPR